MDSSLPGGCLVISNVCSNWARLCCCLSSHRAGLVWWCVVLTVYKGYSSISGRMLQTGTASTVWETRPRHYSPFQHLPLYVYAGSLGYPTTHSPPLASSLDPSSHSQSIHLIRNNLISHIFTYMYDLDWWSFILHHILTPPPPPSLHPGAGSQYIYI